MWGKLKAGLLLAAIALGVAVIKLAEQVGRRKAERDALIDNIAARDRQDRVKRVEDAARNAEWFEKEAGK